MILWQKLFGGVNSLGTEKKTIYPRKSLSNEYAFSYFELCLMYFVADYHFCNVDRYFMQAEHMHGLDYW